MPGQIKDKRPTLIALYRNLTELGRDPNGVTKDVLVDRKLKLPEQLKDKFYKAILQKCKDFDQEYDGMFSSKKDYTNFPYYKNNQYVKKYIEDYPEFNNNPVELVLYLGEGKIKGTKPVGKSVFYYASLIISFGGEAGLPIEANMCAIEVFTPIEKGEEYWLNTFTKALSKFDAKKFKGKKILINECKDSVKTTATASAERKFRFKDGSVITASCAEEAKAKHKVTAAKIPEDIKKSFYFGPDIERFDTSATTHISSSDGSVEIAVLPMSFGDKNWKAVLLINTELNENKVTSAEGDDVLLDKPLIRKITNRLKETCSKYDFKNLETKRVILNKNHTCVVTIVSTYFDKDITEKEVKQKVNSISKDIK